MAKDHNIVDSRQVLVTEWLQNVYKIDSMKAYINKQLNDSVGIDNDDKILKTFITNAGSTFNLRDVKITDSKLETLNTIALNTLKELSKIPNKDDNIEKLIKKGKNTFNSQATLEQSIENFYNLVNDEKSKLEEKSGKKDRAALVQVNILYNEITDIKKSSDPDAEKSAKLKEVVFNCYKELRQIDSNRFSVQLFGDKKPTFADTLQSEAKKAFQVKFSSKPDVMENAPLGKQDLVKSSPVAKR